MLLFIFSSRDLKNSFKDFCSAEYRVLISAEKPIFSRMPALLNSQIKLFNGYGCDISDSSVLVLRQRPGAHLSCDS